MYYLQSLGNTAYLTESTQIIQNKKKKKKKRKGEVEGYTKRKGLCVLIAIEKPEAESQQVSSVYTPCYVKSPYTACHPLHSKAPPLNLFRGTSTQQMVEPVYSPAWDKNQLFNL